MGPVHLGPSATDIARVMTSSGVISFYLLNRVFHALCWDTVWREDQRLSTGFVVGRVLDFVSKILKQIRATVRWLCRWARFGHNKQGSEADAMSGTRG